MSIKNNKVIDTILSLLPVLFLYLSATSETMLIDSVDHDMAYGYSYSPTKNWGNSYDALIGFGYIFGGREYRIWERWNGHIEDTVNALLTAGYTIDSADVGYMVRGKTMGDDDTLVMGLYLLTEVDWTEGVSDNAADAYGVRWDSATATGDCSSSCNPATDWTDGGAFEATCLDSVVFRGGDYSNNDTFIFTIPGEAVSDTMNSGAGICMKTVRTADTDDNQVCFINIMTDKESSHPNYIPWLRLYYHEEAATGEGQVIIINVN